MYAKYKLEAIAAQKREISLWRDSDKLGHIVFTGTKNKDHVLASCIAQAASTPNLNIITHAGPHIDLLKGHLPKVMTISDAVSSKDFLKEVKKTLLERMESRAATSSHSTLIVVLDRSVMNSKAQDMNALRELFQFGATYGIHCLVSDNSNANYRWGGKRNRSQNRRLRRRR